MKKNRFVQAEKKGQDVSLQITSMADIFTILLVFLLKSYSSSEASVPPNPAIHLPTTKAGAPPAETLRLEISSDAVAFDGKPVLQLSNFRFAAAGEPDLQPLRDAIGAQRGRQLASAGVVQAQPDYQSKLDTRITVLVDQRVPYQTLKKILTVAASQGYVDFKLASVKEE